MMLHETTSAQTLGLARICVFGLWFYRIANRAIWELADVPGFQPIGVLRLVPRVAWDYLLTPEALTAFQIVTLGLLSLVILGLGPYRPSALATCVLLTIAEGLSRSFGTINHKELGLLLAAYVLAYFPASDGLSLRRRTATANPSSYAGAMLCMAIVFSLTYCLAGARRIALGGVTIYLDGTILRELAMRSAELGPSSMQLGLRAMEFAWFRVILQLGFPLVTLLELLTPFCLFHRRLRWFWITVMAPFHLSTGVLMGIWFTYNLWLIPLLMTDVERITSRWLPRVRAFAAERMGRGFKLRKSSAGLCPHKAAR